MDTEANEAEPEYHWNHALYEHNSDLLNACKENGIEWRDLVGVELEIAGENDEATWHWLVKTKAGFAYVSGWCDYTGWDCQSGAERHDAATLDEALALVPQDERRIFEEMRAAGENRRDATRT